jgi:hypothetical protein
VAVRPGPAEREALATLIHELLEALLLLGAEHAADLAIDAFA